MGNVIRGGVGVLDDGEEVGSLGAPGRAVEGAGGVTSCEMDASNRLVEYSLKRMDRRLQQK